MATKKAKTVVEPPKHVLSDYLHDELADLRKAAADVLARPAADSDETVEIRDGKLGRAVEILTLTRALVREVDADAKVKAKEAAEALAPFVKEKSLLTKSAQDLEAEVVEGLQGAIEDQLITPEDGFTAKSGCRLALVEKLGIQKINADLIGDEFLLPRDQCIDWGKVNAVLVAERAYNKALPAGTAPLESKIKGAVLTVGYTFSTSAPDVVA